MILFSSSYSQNFDSLASSGTGLTWSNDVTLPGWFLFRQPAKGVAITGYAFGTGSVNQGSFYSYGSTGSSERALGGLGSGGSYLAHLTMVPWLAGSPWPSPTAPAPRSMPSI